MAPAAVVHECLDALAGLLPLLAGFANLAADDRGKLHRRGPVAAESQSSPEPVPTQVRRPTSCRRSLTRGLRISQLRTPGRSMRCWRLPGAADTMVESHGSRQQAETMRGKSEADTARLDNAARAGWLYYIAGNSQDEIAQKLRVSRQTAQRLIALSVSEKLIKVRLDHPIARCLDLSQRLKDRYALDRCEVVPSDPESPASTPGIAQAAAAELERWFQSPHSLIVAVGSGRTMRATVDQLASMDCPQHKIVSLVGNIAPDGSASFYDVVVRMSDAVRAPHYPMPLPVIATTIYER